MCTREDSTTAELEQTGKHGVLHASAAAHDDTTAHDASHDTTSHDTATATETTTTVSRHDDTNSIHGQPESTIQQDEWMTHGMLLLIGRCG